MRILNVTAQRPDSTGSGVYLSELVAGFARRGCIQAVLAGVGAEDKPCFPEGVSFYPVCYETAELPYPILGMSDTMPYRSTRYRDMTPEMTAQFRAAFGAQIHRAAEEFRPDVILCHHLYYLTSLVRECCPEIPVFGISHGTDLRQLHKNPWERDYVLRQIPMLNGIFALHEAQKQEISELFGVEKERIHVVGSGYNSALFHPSPEAPQPDKNGQTRLLFAGKIAEKKGVLSLLRAMEHLHEKENWVLELAGGYSDEAEYRRIREAAEHCPCETRFLGKLPQQELAAVMQRDDVFVLPSFFEGLPLVIIEAMACGMRTVCTDLPGIRPWLESQLPGNRVCFVTPPVIRNQDEPEESSLPAFEAALADALETASRTPAEDPSRLEKLSWDGLCERILPFMEDGTS